eukprot:5337464-Prymnesium_polylepis.1
MEARERAPPISSCAAAPLLRQAQLRGVASVRQGDGPGLDGSLRAGGRLHDRAQPGARTPRAGCLWASSKALAPSCRPFPPLSRHPQTAPPNARSLSILTRSWSCRTSSSRRGPTKSATPSAGTRHPAAHRTAMRRVTRK